MAGTALTVAGGRPPAHRAHRGADRRHTDRDVRRAGLLLLPLRAAARARLPVLRDRHHRQRPRRGQARPDGRRAPRCSCSASAPCSSRPARCSATSAATLLDHRQTLTRIFGAITIVLGPGLHGHRRRPDPARVPLPLPAHDGPAGRAAARRAVRPGLGALRRPDPRRRAEPGVQRRQRRARGAADGVLLLRARRAVHRGRRSPSAVRWAPSRGSSGTTPGSCGSAAACSSPSGSCW